MGPRRTLQLAMVVTAAVALLLAMTGAFGPSAVAPAVVPATLSTD